MNRTKSPPVDLEKYLKGYEHRYCTYQDGARDYRMAYWSFVNLCKEAGANIKLRKTALVDLDVLDAYIEDNCRLDFECESEDEEMNNRRKKIENLDELVKMGNRRHENGDLVNTQKVDEYLENFCDTNN